ncbi:hypothetical protein LINPERPRIM_LOCUS22088 [Linum perenne]
MGNCCKGVSSAAVHDDGDDWELLPLHNNHETVLFDAASSDKNRLLPVSSTSSLSSGREQVKIKVSKRELEELISRVDTQGLSSERILARLILSGSCDDKLRRFLLQDDDDDRRCWKPVLQTIPEVFFFCFFRSVGRHGCRRRHTVGLEEEKIDGSRF